MYHTALGTERLVLRRVADNVPQQARRLLAVRLAMSNIPVETRSLICKRPQEELQHLPPPSKPPIPVSTVSRCLLMIPHAECRTITRQWCDAICRHSQLDHNMVYKLRFVSSSRLCPHARTELSYAEMAAPPTSNGAGRPIFKPVIRGKPQIFDIALQSDLILLTGPPPCHGIRISSDRLAEVSPVFKRMLAGSFLEGQAKGPPSCPQEV